jgi:lysophospholipase L1-like esterase
MNPRKTLKQALLVGAVLLTMALVACTPGDPEQTALKVEQPSGVTALARYVAVGNSLTAGFMDSGLIDRNQMASFPMQIAPQLGYTPDPSSDDWFAQPLLAWPGVGTTSLSSPAWVAGMLHWTGTTIAVLDSTPVTEVPGLAQASAYPTPYQNLGIPGAYAGDMATTIDATNSIRPANAFFDIILRNPTFGNVVQVDQVVSQGPTLVTFWIGGNDVLLGAGTGNPVVGENVTSPAVYAEQFEDAIARISDGVNARFGYRPNLVVGNVPSITTVPGFIPKAVFDQAVGGEFPTEEDNVTHVLLSALALVLGGFTDPLPGDQTLTASESGAVETTIEAYNATIDDLADQYDYTVVDVYQALLDLATDEPARVTHLLFLLAQGMDYGTAIQTTYFSLDGVHPNTQGYSFVANLFIAGINEQLELEGADALSEVPMNLTWDPTYPQPPAPLAAVFD